MICHPPDTIMKNGFRLSLFVAAVLLLSGCGAARDGAIIRANSAIAVGRYNFALARLSEAESYTPPPPAADAQIVYLRARCYEGLRRWPEAIGSYQYLIAKHPDTSYAFQAKERLKVLTVNGPVQKTLPRRS